VGIFILTDVIIAGRFKDRIFMFRSGQGVFQIGTLQPIFGDVLRRAHSVLWGSVICYCDHMPRARLINAHTNNQQRIVIPQRVLRAVVNGGAIWRGDVALILILGRVAPLDYS
jgi:hypothetical protein